ncbi:MAG TPA: aldehyde dehydrogenase [Burkholderiales bacterium]|nr:aldehyde dehydrogenase [Burkholderiales bacterium]
MAAAVAAFPGWKRTSAPARAEMLVEVARRLRAGREDLAVTLTRETGRTLLKNRGYVDWAATCFEYYAGLIRDRRGRVIPSAADGQLNMVLKEPLGVVGCIVPFNYPLMLLAWKVAPALAAGCTVVTKPSEFTSASTLEFAKLVEEAGFPPGVFNVVTGFGRDVGTPLVSHPLVRKIAFTGSDATGRAINEAAAKSFKRVTLELGGKSPNIVFADAKIEDAVNGAVSGIFAATGQTCIAGSRLLLQESVHDQFTDKLLGIAKTARMGNPMSYDTQVGPITTRPQYDKVLSYIDIAKKEGAQLLMGGGPASRPECGDGWFVEPTVFAGVRNDMRIAQEEVFGPVLSVIKFKDEDEAAAIANDVRFGLGAGVWTNDIGRAIRMAERIQAGTVWVNTYRAVSYMSPFGGYKDSGLGRENGIDAIREYLQVKSVWINTGAATANPFVMR